MITQEEALARIRELLVGGALIDCLRHAPVSGVKVCFYLTSQGEPGYTFGDAVTDAHQFDSGPSEVPVRAYHMGRIFKPCRQNVVEWLIGLGLTCQAAEDVVRQVGIEPP